MNITHLTQNPHNPSKYTEDGLQELIDKIIQYPMFMIKRPIVYDPIDRHEDKMIILGGNKRFAACERLATWTDAQMDQLRRLNPGTDYDWLETLRAGSLPGNFATSAEGWTEKEKRAFVFADNKSYESEFEFEHVTEEESEEWGFEFVAVPFTPPPVDYSQKNKEIDINDFSDEMTLTFKFNEEDYNFVNQYLLQMGADSKEQALMSILKSEEE